MILNTFADFRSIIRDEARRAYLDLLDRRSGEHVCAFALVTDDDRFAANAAGDTIQRRQQRLAKRPPRNRTEEKYHAWSYAWNTGEWDSIYSADRPCARPSALSGRQGFESMLAFEQAWSSSRGSERAFKRNMLRAMVDALADLDREGIFGRGSKRKELTLFIEITDSNDDEVAKLKTARMLNPAKAARRLTRSLPPTGRLLVCGMGVVGWFLRGRLIALRTAQ